VSLDNAFALIEGHPEDSSGSRGGHPPARSSSGLTPLQSGQPEQTAQIAACIALRIQNARWQSV